MKMNVIVKKGILSVLFILFCLGLLYWALVGRIGEKEEVRAIDLPVQLLDELIGKPAPELQQIKAWKNSVPITLADLSGKFVLLDFWGYWCGPCLRKMPHLMAVYDAFSDRGLMVIGIHNDSVESINEMDEKLAKAREKIWMGRNINFPIALDGGGETKIKGTDRTVQGATTAAYGITAFPTTILIGPDGKVIGKFHAPNLDDKLAKLEKLLGVQAKKPEWRVQFDKVYRLDDGELLRHIPEPYIPERNDFYFQQFSRWDWFYVSMKNMPRIPESTVLTWDEKKNQATGGMDYGYKRLIDLLRDFAFDEKEFDGDPAVLEQRIPGDWIKRDTARREELLKAFENILNGKLNLFIRFMPLEVERNVFVARGTFEFHPLNGEYDNNKIHLFVEKPDPPNNIQGGGGSGDLNHFLDYVGRLGGIWIINEIKTVTVGDLIWRQHSSARSGRLRKDHALFEILLKNINTQTSLRFYEDHRKQKIWLVKGTN